MAAKTANVTARIQPDIKASAEDELKAPKKQGMLWKILSLMKLWKKVFCRLKRMILNRLKKFLLIVISAQLLF